MSTAYYSSFHPAEDSGAKGSAAFAGSMATTLVYLYRRSATALLDADRPNGNVVYTFATADTDISSVSNGWSVTVPAGTNTLYVTAATAYATNSNATGVDPTTTILPAQWTTPVSLASNNTASLNARSVFLYKRQATDTTAPTVPATTTTYTFSTGVLSGTLSGWTQAAPDSDLGKYLYIIVATALSTGTTDTILTGEWKAPSVFSEDGAGYTAYLTNESHTLVAATDGTVSAYTGATGSFVVLRDGTDVSTDFTLSSFSNPQSLGNGASSIYSGNTYTISSGFDTAEDVATLTIRATGTGAHSGIVLDKVFTLSKSKSGATAKLLSIYPSRQIISFDGSGNLLPPTGQDITYTAVKQNTTATVNWTLKDNKGNTLTASSYLSAITGDTVTMTAAQFNNAIAVNSATGVVVTATCDGLTDTTTVVKVVNGTNGTNGTSPLIYDIVTSSPVIVKDAVDATTTGTYSSITIQGKQYDGSTTTNYGWVTVTANGDTEAATATNTASTPFTLSPASTAGKSSYTVKLYNQATVSGATLLDSQTITVVFKGASGSNGTSAIAVIVSNEAHVFPADSSGNVSSYTGSGTLIRLYEGATELAYDGVGTANGTWTVSASPTNITVGTLTDSGNFVTVGQHSGVAAGTDTSSITYTITGKTTTGQAISTTKTQTFSKSKSGANGSPGAAAINIVLSKEATTILAYADGTLAVAANTITGTATLYSGTVAITPGPSAGQVQWAITATSGSTASINTTTGVYTLTSLNGDTPTATLTITGTYNGSPYSKSFTISKTYAGYERASTDPGTGNFEGRVYYNTSTQKLRLYTGGAWTDKTGTAATTTVVADVVNAGSITSAQLSTGELITVSAQIGAGVITNAKIGDLEVDSIKIAGNAVNTGKLAANSAASINNSFPADVALPSSYATTELTRLNNIYTSGTGKQLTTVEATYAGTTPCSFTTSLQKLPCSAVGYNQAAVVLGTNFRIVNYNSSGLSPNQSSVTLTATAYNITTPSYVFIVNGVVVQSGSSATCNYNIPKSIDEMPLKILLLAKDASGNFVASTTRTIPGLLTGSSDTTIVVSKEGGLIPKVLGTYVATGGYVMDIDSTAASNNILAPVAGVVYYTYDVYRWFYLEDSYVSVGDAVVFDTAFAGLTANTVYYVSISFGNIFQLKTTYADAINNTGTPIVPNVTGPCNVIMRHAFTRTPGTLLANNTVIKFSGTSFGGITAATEYYVKNMSAGYNKMQISLTSGGAAVDLTEGASGFLSIEYAPGGASSTDYTRTSFTLEVYKGTTKLSYTSAWESTANSWYITATSVNGGKGGLTAGSVTNSSNTITIGDVSAATYQYSIIEYAIGVNIDSVKTTYVFSYPVAYSIAGYWGDLLNTVDTGYNTESAGTNLNYFYINTSQVPSAGSDSVWNTFAIGTPIVIGTTDAGIVSNVTIEDTNSDYIGDRYTISFSKSITFSSGADIFIKNSSWQPVDAKTVLSNNFSTATTISARCTATLVDNSESGYNNYKVEVTSTLPATAIGSVEKSFLAIQEVKKVDT